MFEVTDEEIEMLLNNQGSVKGGRKPAYSLKDLVKYGLMYAYGNKHYRDGKIVPCNRPFSLFAEHSCAEQTREKPVEVVETARLIKSPDSMLHCWAGYNLAVITHSSELHAYFKKELLFSRQFTACSALTAAADKIYIGTDKGDVIFFDPIIQTETVKRIHSKKITSLQAVNSNLLSSSTDGTIFYKKKITISDSGILAVRYVNDSAFVCSCEDNSVILYRNNTITEFEGHEARILSLTHGSVIASSSEDGILGTIHNERSSTRCHQSMADIGCSRHVQTPSNQIIGFGLDDIKIFDLENNEIVSSFAEKTVALDYRENLLVYGRSSKLYFQDVRTNSKVLVSVGDDIKGVSFSHTGNMIYIETPGNPHIMDIRRL